MRYAPALLTCALLLSGPVRGQEEDGEQAAEEPSGEISAPEATEAPAAAPVRRAGPAYRPGARRAPAPAVGSGGSGGAPARISDDGDGGQSLGGVGIGRAEPEERRPVRTGGVPPMRELGGGAPAGGAGFQEADIGLLPTLSQVTGRAAGDRPVIHVAGGKKWAIKLQSKGSGRANFNILLGGTNGDLTGGGKYRYKAAISKSKGVVSGSGALCPGEMHNAAYTTCQQPCSMKWDLRFGTPPKDRRPGGDTCELDHGQVYYLNVAPEGAGCTGGQAEGYGCPLVMEPSNGAQLYLNPSGVAAACAHRGFGSDGNSCR